MNVMDCFKNMIQCGRCISTISNLESHFSIMLRTRKERRKNCLGIFITDIMKCCKENTVQSLKSRDLILYRIIFLLKHLEEVKSTRKKLWRQFKKDILDAKSVSDYFGPRMEINMCASLIKKGYEFTMPDPPDFIINYSGVRVNIECTSTHIKNKIVDNSLYKIKSAINKKSKKGYALPVTALFVDYTNLSFSGGDFIDKTAITPIVNEGLESSKFGSIICFNTIEINNNYENNYSRFDSNMIDEKLLSFLDETYPFGDKRITGPFFYPGVG